MDQDAQAVLAFFQAIHLAQDKLSHFTWHDEMVEPLMPSLPNGTRRPLTTWVQGRFSNIGGQTFGGRNVEIVISASVDLRKAEAFYGDDRVEQVEWRLTLSYGEESFLIDSRIVAYTTNKYHTETDLLTFPDRFPSTLDDCIHQLAQATSDLAEEQDIIYSLLKRKLS